MAEPEPPAAPRRQRLVFGEDAELYDRARPPYPAQLVDDLTALAGPPGAAVDIGCGTAKATSLLAERGWVGVGIEPDPAMAAVGRRNLAAFAGWTIEQAEFEAWPGPAQPADLVVCAYVENLASQSDHRLLEPAIRDRLLHGIVDLVDANGGSFAVAHRTDLWLACALK